MNKKLAVMMAAIVSSVCLFAGCGNKSAVTDPAPVIESAEADTDTEPAAKEARDILGRYVLGIDDRAILEGAKNIDLLARAESMKKVVTKIDVDDSAVDTTKPGTYKVKYTVTVDVKNLEKAEAYIEAHPEALTPPAQTAEPAPEAAAEKPAGAEETPVQETVPSTEETAPAAQETTPADSEQPAAQTETPAVDTPAGDQTPAETPEETGTAAPAEGEGTAPAEGETQPAAPADPSTEAPAPGTDTGETVTPVIPVIPDEVFDNGTESASGDPAEAGETIEVVIEKDVTVVTPEEAVEIIEGGGEVWTDGSNPATVKDITGEDASQTATTQPAQPVEPAVNKDKDKEKETTTSTDKEYEHDNESSGSGGQSSQSSSSGSGGGSSHTHNWAERTETVYHDEQGHYETVQVGTETVVDEAAWDEPVYDGKCVCSECGYSTFSESDIVNHIADVHDFDASYGVVSEQVDTIHHSAVTHEEPVYEDRWVVDSAAWSEKRVVGYYCTECGATK